MPAVVPQSNRSKILESREMCLLKTITLVVALLSAFALGAPRCPGVENTIPVHTAPPVFITKVPNGKLFLGGNGTDAFYVQHLYGSYYDMGHAHGLLFRDIIPTGLNRFYDWVESQIEDSLPFLPAFIAGLIADFGVPVALEWTWNNTAPYTHPRYVEEMQGIADGAGVSRQDIFNINMIAELIKAQCSIIGANGDATRSSLGGRLVHLRTLDGMGGPTMPIKDYAVVTVYHPNDGGPTVANFGWVSYVGSVTGFGQFVGIGEKYWGSHNASVMSLYGEAWTFVTRDVLLSRSFEDALTRLQQSNRTCAVHLGIGSQSNNFTGVEVAAKEIVYFNDTSIDYPEHPAFKGIIYWDKHSQPTTSYCFPDLFTMYYGNITAELLATKVAPLAQTGDLHAAIFDYNAYVAYFANARKSNTSDGSLYSYNRQFTRLDMAALFNESY